MLKIVRPTHLDNGTSHISQYLPKSICTNSAVLQSIRIFCTCLSPRPTTQPTEKQTQATKSKQFSVLIIYAALAIPLNSSLGALSFNPKVYYSIHLPLIPTPPLICDLLPQNRDQGVAWAILIILRYRALKFQVQKIRLMEKFESLMFLKSYTFNRKYFQC